MESNSIECVFRFSEEDCNIIGHMCHAAKNLYNEIIYQRRKWDKANQGDYPDKIEQKKLIKENMWALALPSQSAQQVVDRVEEAYKSWFALRKNEKVENPHPPKFRYDSIPVYYIQNAIKQEEGGSSVRLTISSELRKFMKAEYGIDKRWIQIECENPLKKINGSIKRITLYPPENGKVRGIIVYGTEYPEVKEDNGKYLSIDIGIHNLLTCLNSETGETFISGRMYLEITRYFEKKIAKVKSEWMKIQRKNGVMYPSSTSKHIRKLWENRRHQVRDYLHKVSRDIVDYCMENGINTVIIGDIKGIREKTRKKDAEMKVLSVQSPRNNPEEKKRQNQELFSLPFEKIYQMIEYKCAKAGIRFVRQNESWSSQCSPLAAGVSKKYATPEKREQRGLFKDGEIVWNADTVGAFNIHRLFLRKNNKEIMLDPLKMKPPYIRKVSL